MSGAQFVRLPPPGVQFMRLPRPRVQDCREQKVSRVNARGTGTRSFGFQLQHTEDNATGLTNEFRDWIIRDRIGKQIQHDQTYCDRDDSDGPPVFKTIKLSIIWPARKSNAHKNNERICFEMERPRYEKEDRNCVNYDSEKDE